MRRKADMIKAKRRLRQPDSAISSDFRFGADVEGTGRNDGLNDGFNKERDGLKIIVLAEDTSNDSRFEAEHGLSLYVETTRRKILFDSGQSGKFADVAATLGVDLAAVDFAVLSHGHYDHGGGLGRFLALNDRAPIYLSEFAFGDYFAGTDRYIGLDPTLRANDRLRPINGTFRFNDDCELVSCETSRLKYPIESFGLTVRRDGAFVPDDFCHEIYLSIREGNRHFLFSGCSHRGVLNIMDQRRPDVFVGGFHWMKLDVSEGERNAVLDAAVDELSRYGAAYYTCHCTGRRQYEYIKRRAGFRLDYLSVGQERIL